MIKAGLNTVPTKYDVYSIIVDYTRDHYYRNC